MALMRADPPTVVPVQAARGHEAMPVRRPVDRPHGVGVADEDYNLQAALVGHIMCRFTGHDDFILWLGHFR